MHISRVDLNLFTVFEAIYTEGSITRASVKMNLTQPAISHALGRLRQLFDDPLFERRGHVMVATPLARSMIEAVRQALRGFELTLNGAERFEAASSTRSFTLALRDILEASMLPPLMARIAALAPAVSLNTVQAERRELESELAAGTIDAAIDVLLPLSPQILHRRLVADRTVVVVRRGHPLLDAPFDLASYLRQEHILASSRRRGPGLEDTELRRHGHQRRIRLRCQHYYAACRVASQTDLVLTMPERLARVINEQFDNRILPFPLPMPTLDVHLYWHANADTDPANGWLREQISQVLLDAGL